MQSAITKELIACGIVAVIRGKDEETAYQMAKAIAQGGILGLEVTFTVPNAEKVIARLIQDKLPGALVGAGSVMDLPSCEKAMEAGAKFIVSPNFDEEILAFCQRRGIPYYPGCFTPTEIARAYHKGAELVKLFPGSALGPSYVKAVHGPLPDVPLMPTGGVDLDNLEQWVKAGVVAVGVGSCLTCAAKNGDYKALTALSKQYVEKLQEARKAQ
ncbi:MAG: bifunctional 4-hydroxy-2-oxoglutarate aldolase/2-dehydro-3-deoxy-phosphogluconate aldolase [Bacilli bacterium]|nr:bifunctional 4-hydroxy-2-oxoglutarate aldolase/2-dehydro-3-deoxy-phosphogluconate aldolase [Bacilli bacterium]